MKYDRPFLTYEQQIQKLEDDYKLHSSDYDFAKKILSTISYHSIINGYKEIFTTSGKLEYNMDISALYSLYKFDRDFQTILFKYSVYVENYFKTKMAYLIAKNISEDHLIYLEESSTIQVNGKWQKRTHYISPYSKHKRSVASTLKNLKGIYTNSPIDEPTLHYKKNHNHIPPWILFRNAHFTDIIDLYSFLNSHDKDEICDSYIPSSCGVPNRKEVIKNSLSLVRKFRNKIAHDLKFASSRFPKNKLIIKDIVKIPFVSSLITSNEFRKHRRGHDDILAMIISIFILLDDKNTQSEFLSELLLFFALWKSLGANEFNTNWKYYRKLTNLPDDLDTKLEQLRNALK